MVNSSYHFRLGKDGLNLAKAAAKFFIEQEATRAPPTATGDVGTTNQESFKKSFIRQPYYVPSFAGSYGNPSPYWTSRSQP